MVNQLGLLNRIKWMWDYMKFDHQDVILFKTPYIFDVSVWEIFMPLLFGAKMIVCKKEVAQEPLRLTAYIKDHKATTIHFVPSMLNAFQAFFDDILTERLASLKRIICSGEELMKEMVQKHYQYLKCPLYNLYGPTEASIDVSCYETKPDDDLIYIGKPISNTRIVILDDQMKLLPTGFQGEICLSGIGLAIGYLNNDELTNEKFPLAPFLENERIYKTGDYGRIDHNGNIVYVGRIDSQIKLRGYRIELGEIENQLLTFEPVLNTAVLCDHDREILIAFIQSAHKVEPYEIESYLTERLPSYMVPSKSIVLTDFPSTASGKIDKKVLREIYLRELNKKNDHEGRLTAVERELRNIWCDALVIDNVGIDDNFFGIGGHSLNAAKLIARVIEIFNIKLELRSIFDSPTIRELAKHIEDRLEISDSLISSNSLYGVEKIEEQDYYEVSHGQWRLWVLDKIEGSQYAYIISNAYSIEHLKLPEFEAAFNDLIKRHEILRTKFVYMDGHLKQKVVERDAININKHDLREEKEKETSINNFAKGEQRIPFDLENEVPIRCTLLQIEDDKYVFILTVHHILVDGWSLQVMVNEVITNYNNRVTNVQTRLPDLTYQYKDYSAWQLDQLNNEQGELHKAYWHNIFSHDLPDLNFPTDFQRPPIQTFNGKRVYKEIDQSIVNDLYSLNSSTNSSLFMTILASLKVLLFKYTGQNDIVVGSPVAGRELIHFQDQIGFYVNTLAIRTELSNNDTFHTFLETVKHNVLEAYEHQIYPYDRLVTELGLNRDMSRTPLYDIALIVQSEETNEQNELIDCKIESLLNEHETSMNDIRILFTESPDRLLISVDYNTDLYADSTIDLLLENYVTLLDNLLHFSDIPLTDVPCISASQNERLYGKLGLDNNVELEEKSIVNLFKEQVHKTPNQPALIFNDESWTYEELDHHSSRLASHLINKFDIKRGEIIGLLVDRSEHMIIAILAILKSGGAYLPIDPNYPDERIQFMLDDSNTRLILTESEYMFEIANLSADVEAFILDLQYDHIDSEITNLDFNIDPTDLAYIIYTSGSTGKPKGVLIEHRGSVNMVLAQAGTFNISQDDRILQFASISFDASVFEILMALLNGGGLVLIESDIINDPVQMIDYCKEKEVSVVTLPPSYLSNLDINKLDFLRIIITAGESAIKRDVERSIEHCQYFNAYGPSEYSVWATYYEASGDEPYSSVPIGIPINNTQVFVVDKQERLTPIGAVGEICLSGPGVARGYLNRPEETAKNFVKSAFDTKTWMYKTGDLGKWLPDGNLEFIGRRDNQIKLRGYRIELNEISQTILTIEGVKDVHVALRGNEKDKQLVAYVVKQEDAGEINIREGLENTLPHYLIPSMFIELEELPLTLNGKIDSEKLSSYDKSHLTNRGDLVEPADSYETKILEIWIEVIGIEKISVLDNFFEVGGDSLKVMKLYSLLNNAYPDVIKVTDLFVHKNIRETADVLRNNQPDQDSGKVGGLKRMTI
ncbi:MAG: amino acid adenylation domain-containing protein [Bacteroidota bacterium]